LSKPGSHCPSCDHQLAWYDNVPIFAWFYLGGKCRYCKTPYSIRYPFVELITALLFVFLYVMYFQTGIRAYIPPFEQGGYLILIGHLILLSGLLASSLIDAEHWIIPLSVTYFITVAALIFSIIWPYFFALPTNDLWNIIPYASPTIAAAAAGATLGILISLLLLKFGIIKRSFVEFDAMLAEKQAKQQEEIEKAKKDNPSTRSNLQENTSKKEEKNSSDFPFDMDDVKVRPEMVRELAFLATPALLAWLAVKLLTGESDLSGKWSEIIISQKWCAGLLGSLFGFMIGGAVVWATRILGSLAFGREAMGMGDVHLMAAVGAMLGWATPLVAFFVAPFFGLAWAITRLVTKRSKEIPYGPFLSMGTLLVMLLHDAIIAYFSLALSPPTLIP
ncbi:MAG: prepilin peptidase, partial [Phycisphaerae bacterium]|nr:prepilin peptidase [Phycisphaerae bacterium]